MTPTGSRLKLSLLWTSAALAAGVVGSGVLIVNSWRIARLASTIDASPSAVRPTGSLEQSPGDVFADLGLAAGARTGNEADLAIRLVGTFFEYAEIGTNSLRHAVLADLHGGHQAIVVEGEQFDSYTVIQIQRDAVSVERLSDRSRYLLRLASPDSANVAGKGGQSTGMGDGSRVASTMSFGGQIATNHWVLNRQELMNYYQELRDNPDRLLKVFDTMKPLRDEAGKITGYTVGIEGEKEFFDAVGLREGDVVRKTNGRPMTNRRLAERFIASGVKGDASAFVLEVERNGAMEKLTYQIR